MNIFIDSKDINLKQNKIKAGDEANKPSDNF
jgi:hypothetical protein